MMVSIKQLNIKQTGKFVVGKHNNQFY